MPYRLLVDAKEILMAGAITASESGGSSGVILRIDGRKRRDGIHIIRE